MVYKIAGVGAVLVLFLFVVLSGMLFESVDADEIMVIQAPTSGDLAWHVTPGIKWQGFGKVTKYQKMSSITFDSKVMFNDNGTGHIRGTFQVELPMDTEHLTALHTKYGNQDAIEKSLVQATIDKVVYMTGPLMSSKESSAERKTDLIRFITDQIEHGIYRTTQHVVTVEDPLTKEVRTQTNAEISIKDGVIERQEDSAINEHGIKIVNFAPNDLEYDDRVKAQISKQQDLAMQVTTAKAQALEAEQRRLTAEADGKANVMQARYQKEVTKIQAVTDAQRDAEVAVTSAKRDRDVAEQKALEALQYKKEQILRGEGESERKKLVMSADGALEQKLSAYRDVNARYAEAIARHQGSWVPSVVMGDKAGSTQGATGLIDLLTARTAKELALDVSIPAKK
jgi:hypothetical protein